ncbi:hypothetical protein CHH83_19425 [Bacillus sp. 7586-K]|nr:hypothetical protein CHH83_19425 [Bacillus sp. 7586-K]
MKLKYPNLTLFDFLYTRELYKKINENELQAYINNEEEYTVIKTKQFIFIYKNNGSCYFADNEDLKNFYFEDPSFFEGINISTNNIYDDELIEEIEEGHYYLSDLYFSEDGDALEWEGDFDGEVIFEEFMLKTTNRAGYADLVGIYELS